MKSAAVIALIFLLAGAALASLISHCTFDIRLSRFNALEGKTAEFEGTVTDVVWDGGYSAVYIIDIDNAGGFSDFSCVVTGNGGIRENSMVSGKALFSPLESSEGFDERRYYLSKGVVLSCEAESITYIKDAGFSLANEAGKLQSFLSGIFIDALGEEEGTFACALLLGDKTGLSDTLKRDFTRLGLSHILAISGMHLTVLCSFVSMLLKPFGKNVSRAGSVFIVVFYMFITGLSPSVIRSGLMLLTLTIAAFFRRGSDKFTNLGIAVFLICIIDPFSCADIGLQLSFAAVFALLLYSTKRKVLKDKETDKKIQRSAFLNALKKAGGSLLESAVLTVVIVLFMLPLEWLYFDQISLISPLTSTVFSLSATVLLWTLPILLMLSPAPTITAIFAVHLRKLIALICTLANKISPLRNITVSLSYSFALFFSILIFLAVIAFCVTKKKKRLICGAVTVLCTMIFALSCFVYRISDGDRVTVSMLEHKKSDGILLASDCRTMLIDIGNGHTGIIREGIAEMSSVQATEIEVFMLTHLHTSHPSALNSLLSDQIVRTVLVPEDDSDVFYSILEICRSHGTNAVTYTLGDSIIFEDCEIRTAPYKYYKRSTQPMILLEIQAFGECFTYLGGAYLESPPFPELSDADYIWFGTHGPLYKETFTPFLSDSCTVFASESAKDHLTDVLSPKKPASVILD